MALFAGLSAQATTYYSDTGASRTWTISLNPGTHTFIVNGITSYRETDWYLNGSFIRTDISQLSNAYWDPTLDVNFTSGTATIMGKVYNSSRTLLETHTWNVTVILPTYTVSATAGTGGTVTPSSRTVTQGNTTTFTVTPATGYSRGSVSGDASGGSWSGNTYTTAAVTANRSLTFSFVLNSYTVTATAGTGGTVSPSSRTVNHGSTTTFTVSPAANYTRGSVSGDAAGGSWSGNTYTTAAVTQNRSLSFSFNEVPRLTGLSWRNSSGSVISSIEAGQTVYVRVDAVGMNGSTVSVDIYEYDSLSANDYVSTVSVTIGSSGYGTTTWTAKWVDDGLSLGDKVDEMILRTSGVSDSSQMTVSDTTGPSAPSLSSPASGATLTTSAVTFSWGSSTDSSYGSGFKNYTLQVDDDPAFGSPLINRTGLTTLSSAETVSANGTYYWRVLAYDNCGNYTASSSRSFIRQTPMLTGLSWRDASGNVLTAVEAGQTVYARVDAVGMNGSTVSVDVYEYDSLSANDYVATVSVTIGASGYGTTAWTAKWVDDGLSLGDKVDEMILRTSGVSDSAQMTVSDTTAPSTASLSSPAAGATLTSSSVAFSWGASTDSSYGSGFKNYTLQVDDDPAFGSLLINRTGLTSPSSTETITPNGTYYWRVLSYDNCGNYSTSASRSLVRQTPMLTGLSWRDGSGNVLSAVEAGQTVYVRVDAVGMSGITTNVDIYEYDSLSANDYVATVAVTIGASGYGTAAWTAKWVDDGLSLGDKVDEMILRTSGVSDSSQMTVSDTTGPSASALSNPADAATLTSSAVTFSWGSSTDSSYGSGFKNYTLQVDDDPAFGSPLINRTGLTTLSSAETVSANGTYYWRVLAYDNVGNYTASSSRSFVRQTPTLTALSWRDASGNVLTAVEAGQTVYARVDAVGMNGQNVAVSVLEYDSLSANDPVTNLTVTIGTGYGTTAWVAKWVDDGLSLGDKVDEMILRASGVSDSAQMTVSDTTGPSASSLSSPAAGATLTSGSVAFSWGASTDSAYGSGFKNYTLQVDDDPAFGSLLINHTGLTTLTSTETVSANGTYYWRVLAYDNCGNYTASSSRSFVRQTAGVEVDAYEQDDSAGAAKVISDGETQNRTIDAAGDEDWARFTVSTSGSSVLLQTGARSGYTGGDTVMYLYGPNGSTTQIGYNDDSNGLWSQITASNLVAGTYYVRVQEYGNNGTIDGYTLFLDVIPPVVNCGDSYEPDDSAGAAKVIADGETQNRTICPAGNEDWARFTVSTAGSAAVLRTGTRSGYAGGDTVMWLYGPNSSTAQIGYSDDANGTLWSEITVSNLAVGTYYVRVQEYGNNGTIDGYTLFLDVIPPTVTCVDTYEPDDSAGTAKVIADGETQNRGICAGNEDWAKFTLTSTSDVLLRTAARSGFTGGDTVMWLYGPNNSTTQIGYNDDANGTRWSQLTLSNLVAGTYYIRVQEYGNNGDIPGYTLFFDATPVAVNCGDSYEADDTAGTAKVITDGETQNRSICPAGNEDWAKFTLTGPSDVLLRTAARAGFAGGDTVLWLYGPNSSTLQIAYNDDFNGAWSQITASNLVAGTYYVRVQEYGNNGIIDGYTLFFDAIPKVVSTDDHGNTTTGATGVSVNSTTAGKIEIPGDVDYFRITLGSAGRLSVYTAGQTDTYGYLKNSSGADIISNDDDGGSGNFRITRDLPAGIYYVAVRHYQPNGTGTYQFIVEFTQPMDPPLLQLANRIAQGATDYFANQYQNDHRKWLFSVSAGGHLPPFEVGEVVGLKVGPAGKVIMNLDMADYMAITPEGIDGYVTVWIDGGLTLLDVGLGIPVVNFGATRIEFDPTEPDPRRSFSTSFLSGSIWLAAFNVGSWSSDTGFSPVGGAFEPHSDAGLSLFETSIGLFRFETHRSILDAATRTALTGGLLSPVAPLSTVYATQKQLLDSIADGRSGNISAPARAFTGKDDGTQVDDSAAIEHFAAIARDGSWMGGTGTNIAFSVVPDLFGIPFVGWESRVRVHNVGNNASQFFVKVTSAPSGWTVGADDGGNLAPIIDNKWDFQVGAGEVADLPFVVAPTASAVDGKITFELWYDGFWPWQNRWLDTRSFAVKVQR